MFSTERRRIFAAGQGEEGLQRLYFARGACRTGRVNRRCGCPGNEGGDRADNLESEIVRCEAVSNRGGRYLVFLFTADEFGGEVSSSEEGSMHWVCRKDLGKVNLVEDFNELLQVMTEDSLNEFQYVPEENQWKIVLK